MRIKTLRALALAGSVALLAGSVPATVAAAVTGVECGLISSYVAPDPLGPTDGSILFGLSGPTETILATAAIDPAVEASLHGLVGGQVTCLDVTADGSGDISSLAFASGGTITGPVAYDAGLDAYIVADRVFAPAAFVDANPALVAILKVPAQAGRSLTLTVEVDTSSGNPTTFVTTSQVDGSVAFSGGDLLIGGATIPAVFVTGDVLRALQFADAADVEADVTIEGDVDSIAGTFDATLGVDTIGCATIGARSASRITLDGVTFALGKGSTAAASLTTGVEAGVLVDLATDGTLTISEVVVAGCGSVAPITPPATDTDTSESMAAISTISGGGLVIALLAGWYGAAVGLRRRSTRPTQDR